MLQSKHYQSNYLWCQIISYTEYIKNCYNLGPSYRLGLRSIQKKYFIKTIFCLFNKNYLLKVEVSLFSNKEHFQHMNFGQNKLIYAVTVVQVLIIAHNSILKLLVNKHLH